LLPEVSAVDVPFWLWLATIIGIATVIALDFVLVARNPREPSTRECVYWVIFYVSLALLFGLGVFLYWGPHYGGQFIAGWLTEYSLSVDNLFVFLIIMSRFAVPRRYQQEVLLVGIVLALIMRGIFIALGAAALDRFHGLFYLFGAFLLYTAYSLLTHDEAKDFQENAILRMARRVLPTTHGYYGSKITVKIDGRRLFTPMLVVMVAIGTTDLLFALDSIPAIFGLTQEPYLVFAANAFALMGLRQLYFLIGDLLDRLIYLSHGLAVILAFIGVKLILEAAHEDGAPWAPEIPIWLSLLVIVGTLAVTAILSIRASRRGKGTRALQQVAVDETLVDPDHPELTEPVPEPPPTRPPSG
jgi:tellurite resistance protein TerC